MKRMKLKFKRAYYCAPIIAAAYSGTSVFAANSQSFFGQSAYVTTLDTPANWNPSGVPGSTTDAIINSSQVGHTGSATTYTTSTNLAFGSFDYNYSNGYFAYVKGSSGAGTYQITLGNSTANSNSYAPSTGDLIYDNSSPELWIASNTATGTLNMVLAQSGNMDVANASSTLKIDSVISGAFQITKTGPGTLWLANSNANTFGGANIANSSVTPVTAAAGILEITTGADLGSQPASTATAPDLIFSGNATLLTSYSSSTTSLGNTRNIQINTGVIATIDSSTATFNISGGISGSGGLVKVGTGNLILNGVSTYSGGTNLSAGTINMNTSSSLATAPFSIGGGTLSLLAGHTSSQAFTSTTLLPGAAIIQVGNFASASSSLALGPVTHTVGNVTDFVPPTVGGGSITTTTANILATGGQQSILGGYATVNSQSTWAVSGSAATAGAISGLSTFDNGFVTAGKDVDVTATSAVSAPATVVNSLRFNTAAAFTVTPSGSLTIATGGILNTSLVGAFTNNISGGTLTSNSSDLTVIQADTAAPFVISSLIIDSSSSVALTKAGAGQLTLTAANTFTGLTDIVGGSLLLTNQFALQNSTLASGAPTFDASVTSNAFSIGGLNTSSAIALANNAATPLPITLTVGGNNLSTTYNGVLSGAGTFIKIGTGTTSFTSGSNTNFTGGLTINNGLLRFGAGGDLGAASNVVTINDGGGVWYNGIGLPSFNGGRGFVLGGGNDTVQVGAITNATNTSSTSLLTIGQAGNASSGILAGPATGTATLVKTGLGTLTVAYNSTYNGGTNASEGILVALTSQSLGVSSIPGVAGPLLISPAANLYSMVNIQAPTAAVASLTNYVAGVPAAGTTSLVLGTSTTATALSIGADNSSTTYSATIADYNTSTGGIGSIIKTGTGTLTLSGSNTYTGGTNVSAGTLAIASATALPAKSNLIIGSSSTLFAANAAAGTYALNLNTLTNTGLLDLGKNSAVIHTGTTPAALLAQIATTFGNGAWNGTSGITSSAAAANSNHLTAIGYLVNDDGSGNALYGTATAGLGTTFDGVTPVDNDLLVKYTYYGDANLDGKVDGSDYSRIDSNMTAGGTLSGWYNGDFNYDGVVNGSDYTLIDNAFNTQGTSLAAELATPTTEIVGSSAVPEPATLSLIAFGTVGLLGSRRRRNSTRLTRAK